MAISRADQEGEHLVLPITPGERQGPERLSPDSLTSADNAVHHLNLPLWPGPLLGRQVELDLIHQYLGRTDVRLLTLTGPGGVGKSRLAVEGARRKGYSFGEGTWFVDMASVDGHHDVLEAVADALELQDTGKLPLLECLTQFVGNRSMLLVLDGCDHVLAACAAVADLIAACPHLKVMATSREQLHLHSEYVMSVLPLPVPDTDRLRPLDQLATSPAVALFVQRAQAMRLDFGLTDANARDVAELCVRLEGLPLAIELAAAQTIILPPSAILRRLDERKLLLKERAQDIPDRHRSMLDAIEWSYEQMDEDERVLFRRLCVFDGGFTIGAAHEIAAPDIRPMEVLNWLSVLVDKSLVVTAAADKDDPRFFITDILRTYGREQLSLHQELHQLSERHASFYLALAERAARGMNGAEQGTWLVRLDQEQRNLRAALQWAIESDNGDLELRLVCGMAGYWCFRGQVREGIQTLRTALSRFAGANLRLRAQGLHVLSVLLRWIGEYRQAQSSENKVIHLAQQLDDDSLLARALMNLGAAFLAAGSFHEARIQLDEALSAHKRVGDLQGAGQTLLYLAFLSLAEGDVPQGETHAVESLTISHSIGDTRGRSMALCLLARIAAVHEDISTAVRLLKESLQLIRQMNEHRLICVAVEESAWLISATGSAEHAAQLLGGADAFRDLTGFARTAYDQQLCDSTLERLRLRLNDSSLARARKKGRDTHKEYLIDMALSLLVPLATSPTYSRVEHRASSKDGLSKREHEVLDLVAQGMSNREIGDRLSISQNTAKFHITSILNKLGVDRRAQIVTVAARRHMLR